MSFISKIFSNPLTKAAMGLAVASVAAEATSAINGKMNKNGIGVNVSIDPANGAGQIDIQTPIGHGYIGFLSTPAVQQVVNQQSVNLQPVQDLYRNILAAQAANNVANAANTGNASNNNQQQP